MLTRSSRRASICRKTGRRWTPSPEVGPGSHYLGCKPHPGEFPDRLLPLLHRRPTTRSSSGRRKARSAPKNAPISWRANGSRPTKQPDLDHGIHDGLPGTSGEEEGIHSRRLHVKRARKTAGLKWPISFTREVWRSAFRDPDAREMMARGRATGGYTGGPCRRAGLLFSRRRFNFASARTMRQRGGRGRGILRKRCFLSDNAGVRRSGRNSRRGGATLTYQSRRSVRHMVGGWYWRRSPRRDGARVIMIPERQAFRAVPAMGNAGTKGLKASPLGNPDASRIRSLACLSRGTAVRRGAGPLRI